MVKTYSDSFQMFEEESMTIYNAAAQNPPPRNVVFCRICKRDYKSKGGSKREPQGTQTEANLNRCVKCARQPPWGT